ncbi:DUF1707 SHOCT-like domain-containing protein [Kibdelosporangium phytohabitans]|uniref:DUF1707 SHOCT-like domain-containing protein n=1 Tax=Kibdelosporangium phytohabitans TaxID=860235 RepID=UPI001470597C|nr:DUF1707 domain-containing protein [Kibdelosporangium phytohabitans]MBE1467198.1 hypothetical protein [Kibdelosporangium phytohabitans]
MTDDFAPDLIRVTDLDRKATEARLRLAHTDGSLTLDELDERLANLWLTRTRRDLTDLVRDLPAPQPPPPPPAPPKPDGALMAMRVLTVIWLAVSAVNLVIWLIVSVTSFELAYPWFIWPLVPPGAVLGVLWWSGVGRTRS